MAEFSNNLRILMSCGEASGDDHAAKLALAIKALDPGAQIRAMGGPQLQAAGVDLALDFSKFASVMGIGAVLARLPRLVSALSTMKALLSSWKPDLLILVDFPDFNLRLAKAAKKLGIATFYFIPPKVWVWRPWRVKTINRYVDRTAVIFPFERKFFESRGYMRAVYVGHPFASDPAFKSLPSREALRQELGLDTGALTLAIFPGSRPQELRRHDTLLTDTLRLLQEKHPNLQVLAALPPGSDLSTAGKFFLRSNVKIFATDPLRALGAADVGLLKSGTNNLQAAFLGLPFVMFYDPGVNAITRFILHGLIKLKEYSPVNIVRPKSVPEIVDTELSAEALAAQLERLLSNPKLREEIKANLSKVRELLSLSGGPEGNTSAGGAYAKAAECVIATVHTGKSALRHEGHEPASLA
jgi:lipid-A-disaccharide synthase